MFVFSVLLLSTPIKSAKGHRVPNCEKRLVKLLESPHHGPIVSDALLHYTGSIFSRHQVVNGIGIFLRCWATETGSFFAPLMCLINGDDDATMAIFAEANPRAFVSCVKNHIRRPSKCANLYDDVVSKK
jgi:hypothetical protein